MLGDLLTCSWMAASDSRGGIGDECMEVMDIDVGVDDVGGPCWGPEDAGDPGILIGIGNRGCEISGPADFGVLGGVGGCPPPEGEFEFPSKADERSPEWSAPRDPKLEPELGESVTDDEDAGGDESFSAREKSKEDSSIVVILFDH